MHKFSKVLNSPARKTSTIEQTNKQTLWSPADSTDVEMSQTSLTLVSSALLHAFAVFDCLSHIRYLLSHLQLALSLWFSPLCSLLLSPMTDVERRLHVFLLALWWRASRVCWISLFQRPPMLRDTNDATAHGRICLFHFLLAGPY